MSKEIHLYFKEAPRKNRYFYGEALIVNFVKLILNLRKKSGIKKVFINLCLGFKELKVKYDVNIPFNKIKPGEPVIILGDGKYGIMNYKAQNPIIAGIGLMTHPAEWPNLFKEYPVAKYLQHSTWTNNIYIPYYGIENCELWPAGIDTNNWKPVSNSKKTFDILIYNKIHWDKERLDAELLFPIFGYLNKKKIKYNEIIYGKYKPRQYKQLLSQCRAMVFLSEHESQGFASCEAMSMNIPLFAWDQGYWLDPNRYKWTNVDIPATSVPFFDQTCGERFKNYDEFEFLFENFWNKVQNGFFTPRQYIIENISLKKSTERMLKIIDNVYK